QVGKVVYAWGADPIFNPSLAVDNTVPSFTDPDTNAMLTNPNSGNVYIAFQKNWTPFNQAPNSFKPTRIELMVSGDGGFNFGGERELDGGEGAGSFFGTDRNGYPRITVSQGTMDGHVAPGQVTVVWDDFGSLANATPDPLDIINS